jgi:hypothetical protein
MQSVRLPFVIVIALASALAGGAISYLFVPKSDPELKALLQRQLELAEQDAADRRKSAEEAKGFFGGGSGVTVGDGKPFEPEW